MMRRMLAVELRRAFSSSGFAVSALFMVALSAFAFYRSVSAGDLLAHFDALARKEAALNLAPDWFWGSWLGSNIGFEGYLYLLLLPLLAVLPHGASLLADWKSGLDATVCTRVGRGAWYGAKWAAAFASGAVIASIPLLLNLALCLVAYPPIAPQLGGHSMIDPVNMLSSLHMTAPWLWMCAWTAILACAGGVFAMLGLAVSFITEHPLVVCLLPFLAIYVASTLSSVAGFGEYGIFSLLRAASNGGHAVALALELGALAVISMVPVLASGRGGAR